VENKHNYNYDAGTGTDLESWSYRVTAKNSWKWSGKKIHENTLLERDKMNAVRTRK
jgi:hypothetical protein